MSHSQKANREVGDEELVRLGQADPASQDGRRAVAELFGRYQRAVYLWCFRYVKDHDRALDLSQDVFLSAYKAFGSFKSESRFSSWLFSIARNRCLNEVKRVSLFSNTEVDTEMIADKSAKPDQQFEAQEDRERMLAIIKETLDPLEQKAIWLRCFERVPVDEITTLLKIDSSTGARGVLQRARRKLKAALDHGEPGEGEAS